MICKICKKEISSYAGLATHIRRSHNITSIEYYDKYIDKSAKYCKYCGSLNCKFRSIKDGYSIFCDKYCDWNYRREYGWSEETIEKMSKSSKKRFENPQEREKISNSVKKLWDEEFYSKDHISNLSKTRSITDEERKIRANSCRNNFKGKNKTELHKEKLRLANFGKKQSIETIEKKRLKQIGRKQPYSFIEKMSGENNPNWKGGYRKKYGEKWVFIREDIIRRDKNKCQICGTNRLCSLYYYNKDLNVHHIISRRNFDDINKSNNHNNLITLCSKCHGKVDNDSRFFINTSESIPIKSFYEAILRAELE